MSAGKRYVLDANVFIEAHKKYYAADICPAFWSALLRQHKAGRVCSVDRVKNELLSDGLKQWARKTAPAAFFKGTSDNKVIETFGKIVNWVQNEQQFTQQAKAEFSSVADGWLVAYGRTNGLVVVTHEEYAPDAKSKVKIPNVCIEFEVEYCDTFDMLRELKEQFVLKTRRRKM